MATPLDHPFFKDLPPDQVEALARITRPLRFASGERLFEQGDPADLALFLTGGEIELQNRVPGGGANTIATLGPGEVLGELSLIDRHRRSSSAVAAAAVTALGIERRDFAGLCAQYHPTSLELMHRLAKLVGTRLRNSNPEARMELAARTERCELATELDADAAGATFDVRPFLPVLAFFRDFSEHDLDEFVSLSKAWTLERGRVVTSPADTSRSCFVVIRGAVESREEREGVSFRHAVLGPGHLFGELAWLLDAPRGSVIRARETCTLLELPAAELDRMRDPARHLSFRFHEGLVRSLMERLGTQTRALARNRHRAMAGIELGS